MLDQYFEDTHMLFSFLGMVFHTAHVALYCIY
jgi:hypothetical protein